jgi:transposase
MLDPYMEFIRQTLDEYPRLTATRIHQMLAVRGYTGSVVYLRRIVAALRPPRREAFLKLQSLPGEQAQADWAHFGEVAVGRARRRLSCFVITLSYSRALYLEFFFDQTQENFLRGHVHAFEAFTGTPRVVLYDNLKSAVLERRGSHIHFHPRLLELCGHYHFDARACQVRAGNQKGRVERAIRYVRDSFWAGRDFITLEECNRQALLWRDQVAHRRPWPQDSSRTVEQVFGEEQPRLVPLPAHGFPANRIVAVRSGKTIYVRFDRNDYSIPPHAVGQQLSLIASDTEIRILDSRQLQIALHRRSYDCQQVVLDPAHQQALLEIKRKAVGYTPSGRLAHAVPESETLLDRAFAQGEPVGHQTSQLLKLLDEYGAPALRGAIAEALERDTPRACSVAFPLHKRQRHCAAPPPVDLSRHPEANAIAVRPRQLEIYDQLARPSDGDPSSNSGGSNGDE